MGREEWVGTPTEPQALAAQLNWGRWGGGMGRLHSLQAGPLNLLRCPINRQQPCAQLLSASPTRQPLCPLAGAAAQEMTDCRIPGLPCSEPALMLQELLARSQWNCKGHPAWGIHTPRGHPAWGVHTGLRTHFGWGVHWLQKPLWVTAVSILASEIVLHGEVFLLLIPGLSPSEAIP